MSAAVTPTICGPNPGFGLRVRLDGPHALAIADFNCPCGHAEGVTGDEVTALVARFDRHQLTDCPIPAVREAAAQRKHRREHPPAKRRK